MNFRSMSKAIVLGAFVAGLGLSGPSLATELEDAVAAADADAGQSQFRRCGSCHTAEEGGANRVGPNLWGIVDRDLGSIDGFRYSRTLAGAEDTWTLDNLNAFLENPRSARPGTSMGFPGVRNEEQRMDLLAYLATLRSMHDDHMDGDHMGGDHMNGDN